MSRTRSAGCRGWCAFFTGQYPARQKIHGPVVNVSPQLAIRDGQWKLLVNPDGSRLELYDIVSDPMQVDDVAEKFPQVAASLSATVIAWEQGLPPGPVEPAAGRNEYPWPKAK